MSNRYGLVKDNHNNIVWKSIRSFLSQRIATIRAYLTTQRAENISGNTDGFYPDKAYGSYRRFHGTNVLDASFFRTADGRWYGGLRLNNWIVKETYMNTPEDIRDWCFDSFMELHPVGWQEGEVTTRVVRG